MRRFQNWLQKLHKEKPFIEPIFLFITTSLFGFSSTSYTSCLLNNMPWDNFFLWISLGILGIVILYYVFFSTYAKQINRNKNKTTNNKTKLTKTYLTLAEQHMIQGDIDSHKKATYIYEDTWEHVRKVNGDLNE